MTDNPHAAVIDAFKALPHHDITFKPGTIRYIKHGDGKTCPDSPERKARRKTNPPPAPRAIAVIRLDGTVERYGS